MPTRTKHKEELETRNRPTMQIYRTEKNDEGQRGTNFPQTTRASSKTAAKSGKGSAQRHGRCGHQDGQRKTQRNLGRQFRRNFTKQRQKRAARAEVRVGANPEMSRKRSTIMTATRKMKNRSLTLKLWMKSNRHNGEIGDPEHYFQRSSKWKLRSDFWRYYEQPIR